VAQAELLRHRKWTDDRGNLYEVSTDAPRPTDADLQAAR
jgi:hypothetical protein